MKNSLKPWVSWDFFAKQQSSGSCCFAKKFHETQGFRLFFMDYIYIYIYIYIYYYYYYYYYIALS